MRLTGDVASAGSLPKGRMTSVGSVDVLDQRPTRSHYSPVPVSSLTPRSNVLSPSTSQHAFRLTPHESSLRPPRLKCSEINPTSLPGEVIHAEREYAARLETGRHDPPMSTLAKLVKALKVKVTQLLE